MRKRTYVNESVPVNYRSREQLLVRREAVDSAGIWLLSVRVDVVMVFSTRSHERRNVKGILAPPGLVMDVHCRRAADQWICLPQTRPGSHRRIDMSGDHRGRPS